MDQQIFEIWQLLFESRLKNESENVRIDAEELEALASECAGHAKRIYYTLTE